MSAAVELQERPSVSPPPISKPTFDEAAAAAVVHIKENRHAEAEKLLREAIRAHPEDVELWNLRGIALRNLKRVGESVWCYRQALTMAPERAALWSNLGLSLKDLKYTASAIVCHQRALDLEPNNFSNHHNLGLALTIANRHVEAMAAFDRAVALQPKALNTRWDRARGYLHLGDYRRGWPEYEVRLKTGQLPTRKLPGEPWKGQRYAGKRLLIVSEQGFGDAIWIARYLKTIKQLGGELIMECRPPLIPLIASMGIVDRIVPKADPLPEADFHIHQCSISGLYTRDFASIPKEPYFVPEPARIEKFVPLMGLAGRKLRVGIVWSGSTTFGANHDRAVSLKYFLQWFALPNVQLYSLQKGPPERQLKSLPAGVPIIDLAPLMSDFADTAAAISRLDLVIMTDSAVAHLTGALGKLVWVLLNFVPHWLWLLDRADSPWYPSMRLFRQHAWGDWTNVFDQAAAALWHLSENHQIAGRM